MDALGKLEKELREQREKEVNALMQIVKEEQQNFIQWLKDQSQDAQSTIKEDTKKMIALHKQEMEKISASQIAQMSELNELIAENRQELRGNLPSCIIIMVSFVVLISLGCYLMRPSQIPPPSVLEIPQKAVVKAEDGGEWINLQQAKEMGIQIRVRGDE